MKLAAMRMATGLGMILMLGASMANAQTYTSNNLSTLLTHSYGTFISGGAGDFTAPFTPTDATVLAGDRIYNGTTATPVIVKFTTATDSIRVFANIDHPDASYDGYQYEIEGSTDGGVTFGPVLFDAITANGPGPAFTLGTSTGTRPTTVNNVTPGGTGGGSGVTGFVADFTFGSTFNAFRFQASTLGANSGNPEPEFSGIASLAGTAVTPEPSSLALILPGLLGLGGLMRRRRKSSDV